MFRGSRLRKGDAPTVTFLPCSSAHCTELLASERTRLNPLHPLEKAMLLGDQTPAKEKYSYWHIVHIREGNTSTASSMSCACHRDSRHCAVFYYHCILTRTVVLPAEIEPHDAHFDFNAATGATRNSDVKLSPRAFEQTSRCSVGFFHSWLKLNIITAASNDMEEEIKQAKRLIKAKRYVGPQSPNPLATITIT
ncbi:uncharacterized protein BT62DRAFT_1009248 [Guyanagaster necrorhizus]|uniref:Uncharacterized protein n=1 Tax=Guyanagaster necrorhizus TaxID=856835 RepID=A0A9P8APX5_9AGAR|nr:uncharacterized protein BT62DRAFT_1009248 [Guyanagaster necrorhizus MCA 3950]KAG7443435.1 hypothetical protein BT62DRAFT_1009248 [Guyanagaster necrorhizus MCA 3950]